MEVRRGLLVAAAGVLLLGGCGDAVQPAQGGASTTGGAALPPEAPVQGPADTGADPAPATIEGTVRDAQGRPVAGAAVAVRPLDGGAVPEVAITTGAAGEYALPALLEPGRYEVSVDAPAGRGTAVATVVDGGGPARADLALG